MKTYPLTLFFIILILSLSVSYSQDTNNENKKQNKEISYFEIDDQNFEDKLLVLGIDDKKDGKIEVERAKRVRYLNLEGTDIKNLKNIKYFKNLIILDCSNNKLRSLDLRKNTRLEILICNDNFIGELDLKNNQRLKWLTISNNPLESLNITTCSNLKTLDISRTYLSKIDLHKNINLQTLWVNNMSKLLSLDLRRNPKLLEVYSYKNSIIKSIFLEETLLKNLTLFDSRLSPKLTCIKLNNGLINSKQDNWNIDSDIVFKCKKNFNK